MERFSDRFEMRVFGEVRMFVHTYRVRSLIGLLEGLCFVSGVSVESRVWFLGSVTRFWEVFSFGIDRKGCQFNTQA